jgi:hypothetical protein
LSFVGEWEQALSRKDKKNRKKDDPLANDDAVSENIGNIVFFSLHSKFISLHEYLNPLN